METGMGMEMEMEHNQINRIVIKGVLLVWVTAAMGGSNNTSSNTTAQIMKEGDKGKGVI